MGKMNTVQETRYQLERLMRANLQGSIDPGVFRNLVYSFSVLLQYHKTESEQEIEKRLDAIEAKLLEAKT